MTLIIYELWKNNKSIWHVSSEFNLDRGFVQQIIQSSASFTNGVLHFCEHLDELWPYKNLMQDLMKRLQYNCSQDELLAIMELDNVRLPRAQQLFNSGYTNIELIAKAEPKEICEKIKLLPWNVAEKLIKSANVSFFCFIFYSLTFRTINLTKNQLLTNQPKVKNSLHNKFVENLKLILILYFSFNHFSKNWQIGLR